MAFTLAIIYALVLLALGYFFRKRNCDREGTYLAGRRLGAGLIAATLTATTVGGSATVVLASFVYEKGLAGLWLDLPVGLSLLFLGLFMAGRIRATGAVSLPDFAGKRFGVGFRRTSAVLVVLAEIAWFALLVKAAAPFLSALGPFDETTSVLVLAAVFVSYTAMGGQAAVAWTDGLQLILVGILGLAVPAVAVLVDTKGLAGLPAEALSFPTNGEFDALAVLGMVALVGLPGLVGGDVYSKILSARNERAARLGTMAAGGMKLLATGLVGVIALGAGLYPLEIENSNGVLPVIVQHVLPAGLWPLAALGFLAAMMSSADSVLLTGATVLDYDLLPAPRRERLRSVFIIVALGSLGTVLALRLSSVVEIMKWAYTLFAAGAPLPILLGFQRRVPIPPWAASTSLVVGGLVAVACKLAGIVRPEPVLIGLFASGCVLAAGALRSRLHRS